MLFKRLFVKYKALSLPTKASLWYTFANVLVKGVALLSTPIFTRVMTTEEYGTFTIFQSWYNIILIFTSLNIFLGGYTKGLLIYRNDIKKYTSSSLALIMLITCIFGLVYVININFWTQVFELSPILMAAMFIELLTMPAFELWGSQARFDYKYRKFVITSVFMSIMSILLGIITVINSTHKVEARTFSDVFSKTVICIVLVCSIFISGKCFYNKKYWVYNLKFNLPLIPHYLSNYLLNQSDRIMISKMVGNTQAAYYSVAYTIATMMNLVITALNNALTPYIYKSIDKGSVNNIKSETTPLFLLVTFLCVLTMAFAPEIIVIFAGSNYEQAIYVIPPIAASVYFIFVYSMFSTIEYFYQKTVQIAFATTISAILNVGLNYFFIRLIGYYAAAYTTLISYIVLAGMHYIFYRILIKKKLGVKDIYNIKVINICAVVVLLVMLVMTMIYRMLLIRYGLIVVMLVVILLKGNDIKKVITNFKKEK